MGNWLGMAHDAGARGDEAREMAARIEQEERERAETLRFEPDYCVPPGATLRYWLEENSCDVEELAERSRLAVSQVRRILTGEYPISDVTAAKLGVGTGISYEFWRRREDDYRRGLAEGKTQLL